MPRARERIVDEFRPNRKQAELWSVSSDPAAEEILMDGAIRTGKSQSCARLQVAWALKHPGTIHWAMRKTQKELDDTTKRIYLDGDGGLEPAIPTALRLDYNQTKDTVTIRCPDGGESYIVFRALESRKGVAENIKAKLRGTTLASVFIDQVEEFDTEHDHDSYFELLGRLSDPRGPNKMLLCSNPGSKGHWLWQRIVNPATREEQCRYVHVELADNKHNLAPGYWERMERTKKTRNVWWRRFVKGEWGVAGGIRFPCLDEERHIIQPFPLDPGWPIIESIDYGWANLFVCLWHTIDYEGRWYVIAEHAEKERSLGHHARAIKETRARIQEMRGIRGRELEPDEAWWDPSMWARRGEHDSLAIELMDYGISGAKAQNERRGGWARIEELLTENLSDELPKLMFWSTCTGLWNELGGLKCKPGSDDVEKEHDHHSDALRYAIMSRAIPPSEPKDEKEDPRARYLEQMRRKMAARTPTLMPGGIHA